MPASDRWEGLISRLPDSSSVNRGSWTEPLAKTRSPVRQRQAGGTSRGGEGGPGGKEVSGKQTVGGK